MSTPLSPIPSASLNAKTPSTAHRNPGSLSHRGSPKSPLINMDDNDEITYDDDPPSSPFVSMIDQENVSPMKPSVEQCSPLKDVWKFAEKEQTAETPAKTPAEALSPIKTSRKNRSPSKSSAVEGTPAPSEPTLRDNEGLTIAIDAMEQDKLADATFGDISYYQPAAETLDVVDEKVEETNVDDTCFSNFSEIPNTDMTMFAKLGNRSPAKQLFSDARTPRRTPRTPGTARKRDYNDHDRSPSPTPRRHKTPMVDNDTTNLLLDFTQQMDTFAASSRRSPSKRNSPTKSTTESNLRSYLNEQRSPRKSSATPATPRAGRRESNLLNLLDFDLPPAPTPRSVPTITVRELESVKSSYQSQISSLTATLSGRAAEVESLKKAVADAERRVGESQEQVRDEVSRREHAEREKAEWEKRGIEVEEVLRSIREEVIGNEKEREELLRKLEESERRTEEAEARSTDLEARAIEAEGKLVDQSTMAPAADSDAAAAPAGKDAAGPTGGAARFTAEEVQKQIDEKVATLCRELHVVYKKKHETKVAALKKSYESKAEKKTTELSRKIDDLTKQITTLQSAHDATQTKADMSSTTIGPTTSEADLRRLDAQAKELESQKAQLASLTGELEAARAERALLKQELDAERREKGELVAAVDEMLALQAEQVADGSAQNQGGGATPARARDAVEDFRRSRRVSVSDEFRRSTAAGGHGASGGSAAHAAAAAAADKPDFRSSAIGRPSGLRTPGSRGSGLARPAVQAGKSRMMSNIERMGSGRGGLE
ncbi:uncharacterized protein K452DRAFT_305915 [Aplosporella prunicola CBS 121167]|uniref:Uncharacterized protein n=1 Tax=Aplosporella prunicola CBS 121167 TaxID=1176127 RepID=A0A6A6BNG6_9PEZI|nr:uncharacterized protein K452DRAFT_305915 [Aplosporella prunicola CBS 121167]KAF2144963.1 hypothetical protein K452DRAFT_305915 [Aplosporella prunicola CBS 121167]